LRERAAALCTAAVEAGDCSVSVTAAFGYQRLRRETYPDGELAAWAGRIVARPWQSAFVFFQHEEAAPAFAQRLCGLVEG
jgi:hypothetical protein